MKKIYKEEKGTVTLLVAFMMVIFIGLSAVVIDGGNLYLKKSTLQKAVDAAVLAAAQELPTDRDQAMVEVRTVFEKNKVQPLNVNISFYNHYTMIKISAVERVKLFYGGFFGYENVEVNANASVQLQTLASAKGTVPLGVEKALNLQFGEKTYLKVGDSTVGNFGALALTGPGAKNYEEDLKDGYDFELLIGEKLATQTGNIVGPTQRAINHRINSCSINNATYDHYPSDCPRVVTVPVFESVRTDQNQIKEVKVVGFASFFIEGFTENENDVVGRFIENTISGAMDPTAKNYGTYSFKIVE